MFVGNKYTTANDGFYDLVNWLNGGWYTWQFRQAELDRLNEVLDERTKEWLEAIKLGAYFQEAAKPLKDEVDQLTKTLSIKSNFLEDSDVTNKFLSEQLEEKDKRIVELEARIKGQIETLICASKSWLYTEREQNIMLSQADDLDKALRGEHE